MRLRAIVVAGLLAAVSPATAQADWLLTPFIGAAFGGDVTNRHLSYGASLAYMGQGAAGFEIDFSYSPDVLGDDEFDLVADSNVTTLMANFIVGAPFGGTSGPGVRPYLSGGAGLLRTNVSDADDFFSVDNSSFGVNAGAGIAGLIGDNVGIRGDVRYFRSLQDPEEDNEFDIDFGAFDFWRATVGVTFRF